MRTALEILLLVAAGMAVSLLIAAYILLCTFLKRRSDRKKKKEQERPPRHPELNLANDQAQKRLDAMESSEECITIDGRRLYASYYPSGGKKAVLLVHGYNSSRASRADAALFYSDRGFALLLPDLRSHGKSEGRYIGMGYYERRDILAWMGLIRDRMGGDAKIVLDGISMGGATVLMAAGERPEGLCAVVADCAFSSAYEVFFHRVERECGKKPAVPLMWFFTRFARLFTGYDLRDAAPVRAVGQMEAPVLFMHGEADDFVPYAMMRKLYEACASKYKRMVSVAGADHAMARITGKYACEAAMDELLAAAGCGGKTDGQEKAD